MDVFQWRRLSKLYYDKDIIDDFIDYILSSGEVYIKDKLTYNEWEEIFADLRSRRYFNYENQVI